MNEHHHGGAGPGEARGYGGDAGQEAGGAGARWGQSGNGAPMGFGQNGVGPGGGPWSSAPPAGGGGWGGAGPGAPAAFPHAGQGGPGAGMGPSPGWGGAGFQGAYGGPGMGSGGAGVGPYGYHAPYGASVPPHAGYPFYGAPAGTPRHGPHAAASEPGMAEMMAQLSGGSGLSSLGRLLGTGDGEFWKGALIGAAAVLLLTNESVQRALFRTGAKASEAVKSGVEKVRKTAREERQKVREEQGDE